MERKLYRDEHRKMVGGVCAGLADYFSIDVSIVRIIFLVSLCLKGAGALPYIVLWIVLPKKNTLFAEPTVDYTVPPTWPDQPFEPGFKQPFQARPYKSPKMPKAPRGPRSHTGSIIGGTIMLMIGLALLSNQLDLIPYYAVRQYWPVVIIVIGLIVIFANNKKEPWETPVKPEEKIETKPEDLNPDYPVKDTPSNI